MGILSALLGNASEVDADRLEEEFDRVLGDGEEIQKAYRVVRDLFVFTDRRLVLVDRQGVTGKKTMYHSIPYRSIRQFTVETQGHFDLEAELKIWVAGVAAPIEKTFRRDSNILDVQRALATYIPH